jgi:sec-independent protein translocase protein TatB
VIEISLGKLVLLALVALIVLGPEKLPQAARTAGALVRRLRSGWDSVRAEVERELEIEELKRTAREAAAKAESMQKEMNQAARDTREQMASAATDVRNEVKQVQQDLNQTAKDAHEQVTAAANEVRNEVTDVQKEVAQIDAPKESEHGRA